MDPPRCLARMSMFVQSKWTWAGLRHRRQQMVDGTVLSVDGSHKLVKFVRIRGGGIDSQPFYCIMTIYNEFQQVCPG